MAKKLARFDNSKHPRGSKGRFVETPDPPGLAKARVYGTDNSSRKASRKRLSKSQEAKLDEIILARAGKRDSLKASSNSQLSKARVYGSETEARKLMLSRMNQAQKLRLLAAFEAADKQLAEAVAKAKAEAEAKTEPKEAEAKTKTKRPKLTPEEKAAKEAKKAQEKAAKEAEKQRKAEEKAAKEAEKEAKIAATASKARKKALDLLAGKQYKGVETLDTINRYSIKAENGMPVLPKEPTARPKVNRSNINFSGDRVDIWQGQPELAKHTGGFKVKREKGYKYSVDVDGKEVLLNRNETMITFEGERVHGVPSIHSRLREIDNDNLVARLAESMQHVENHVDRSIKAPAIDW